MDARGTLTHNGVEAGWARLELYEGDPRLKIDQLRIQSKWQRRGFAKLWLDHLQERCSAEGVEAITLYAVDGGRVAWARRGFTMYDDLWVRHVDGLIERAQSFDQAASVQALKQLREGPPQVLALLEIELGTGNALDINWPGVLHVN